MYEQGRGVEVNDAKPPTLPSRLPHMEGIHRRNRSRAHECRGPGVRRDNSEAVRLFRLAAERGMHKRIHSRVMYNKDWALR